MQLLVDCFRCTGRSTRGCLFDPLHVICCQPRNNAFGRFQHHTHLGEHEVALGAAEDDRFAGVGRAN